MNRETLWAPWRMAYLRELERRHAAQEQPREPRPGDFLTDYWKHPDRDDEQHVLVRDDDGMVLLNRYPYANGHLLVALGDARPTLLDYTGPQRAALWRLVDRAVALCHEALAPQGVNVGVNEGDAAGAGVPEHLHVHVVPRWRGDTNFMATIADVRVIPDALDAMASQYRAALARAEAALGDADAGADASG